MNRLLFKLYLTLCFSWVTGFGAFSQRVAPTRFTTSSIVDQNSGYQFIDSSLNEVEIFHPMYKNYRIFNDLGNIGSAGQSAVFTPQRAPGFVGLINPFETYALKASQAKYYNTSLPFTELFFAQGAKELLFLKASHAQNILPRWSVGLDYQRLTSEGFYLHQKNSHYNIQTNSRYHSKNKRYELLAAITWNKGQQQENGGITNDSAFEALQTANKIVDVNLKQSTNSFHHRSIFIKNYYKFGAAQSVINGTDTLYDFKPRFMVSHSLTINEQHNVFTNKGDSNSYYLPNTFLSSTPYNTYDSVYTGLLENTVQLHYINDIDSLQKKYAHMSVTHQGIRLSQPTFVDNTYNLTLQSEGFVQRKRPRTLSYGYHLAYVLSGYNQTDYVLQVHTTYETKGLSIRVMGSAQQYKPEYNYLRFTTNQFIWNNETIFAPVKYLQGQIQLKTKQLKHNAELSANWYQVDNYTYLSNTLIPKQTAQRRYVWQVYASKNLALGKFNFTHQIHFQHSTGHEIPLPKLGGMFRYYFQTHLFSSLFQVGIAGFYNSTYYAMGWSPASRMFFVQNTKQLGNYVLINPFINLQIKRASVFFMYEHANQNLINKGFYNSLNYPLSLTSFRMGIRWRMYN